MPKNNKDNLKSLAERTTKEQREIATMGGIASGEARREKKRLKEALTLLLEMTDARTGKDNQETIAAALIGQAKRGNVRAFEVIRDTIGEKPTDVKEIKGNISLSEIVGDEY